MLTENYLNFNNRFSFENLIEGGSKNSDGGYSLDSPQPVMVLDMEILTDSLHFYHYPANLVTISAVYNLHIC
ncbi:hypothetical protein NIES4074_01000 [Cylindrospermum sp. NIES-4074]|nr:hypothetical protein NIES4074_01000 [Cylindrospermum sp. NIES-4074]